MMKARILAVLATTLLSPAASLAQETISLESYLSSFDYEKRADMKVESKSFIPLLLAGKAVLVDIRFPEEVAAWRTGFALTIPLNELPRRLQELPKDKLIVTACPHKDRAIIAMTYLTTMGFRTKYLSDGLVSLAEYLRGERARDLAEHGELPGKSLPSLRPGADTPQPGR
jgi:rhodanese-related sulfurtransferase